MKREFWHGDCLDVMDGFDTGCIDLTVTSPPYDNLRTYKGTLNDWTPEKWQAIIRELFRVTKQGGVVVWVVGDATIKGSETGNSFRQALYAMECGFRLHDTMIWHKTNPMPQVDRTRFCQSYEFMFVWSKGAPSVAHPTTQPTKNAGKAYATNAGNSESIKKASRSTIGAERIAFNVRSFAVGGRNFGHPAIFPESLARDHILSWSNPGDTVFDPFLGSGTTGKMALLHGRNFIGIERDEEYFQIAQDRINGILGSHRK